MDEVKAAGPYSAFFIAACKIERDVLNELAPDECTALIEAVVKAEREAIAAWLRDMSDTMEDAAIWAALQMAAEAIEGGEHLQEQSHG